MSKLAMIRQYQYSPAAGGFFSFLAPAAKAVGGLVGKALGIGKKAITAAGPAFGKIASDPTFKSLAAVFGGQMAYDILTGKKKMPTGASGGFGRRRARGITALELRGYRKVANLIHKEGMVSRRARGRKHS